jgi:hypothetical protein
MKTLSVKAPWAYYLAAGLKDVENRSWKTDYRGPIALHVSGDPLWILPDPGDAGGPLPVLSDWYDVMDWRKSKTHIHDGEYWRKGKDGRVYIRSNLTPVEDREFRLIDTWMRHLTTGVPVMASHAIIGTAILSDIVRDSTSPWAERSQYHWLMTDACLFEEPVLEIKGALGLWSYEGSLPASGR